MEIGPEILTYFYLYIIFYILNTLLFISSLSLLNYKYNNSIESFSHLNQLAYLYKSNPLLAVIIASSLFSLSGIPPFSDFF